MAAPFFDVFLPSLAGIAGNAGKGTLEGMAQAPGYALDLQARQFELDKNKQLLPYDMRLKQAHADYYENARAQQKASLEAQNELMKMLQTNPDALNTPIGRWLSFKSAHFDPLAQDALAYQRQQLGGLSQARATDVTAQTPGKVNLLTERAETEDTKQGANQALEAERKAMVDKIRALEEEIRLLMPEKKNLLTQKVETEVTRADERRAAADKEAAQTEQTKTLTPEKVQTEDARQAEMNARAGQINALTNPKVDVEKARKNELQSRADSTTALQQPRIDVQKSLAEKNRAQADKSAKSATGAGKMDERAKMEFKAGLDELKKDSKSIDTYASVMPILERWESLNKNTMTGPGRRYSPDRLYNSDLQTMLSLENNLAMNNFKPGQGAMSNFERSLIKGGGPSVDNVQRANQNIIDIMKGGQQTLKERTEFRQWYLQKNGRLLGSERAWNKYVEANPRYIKDKKGGVQLNSLRENWDIYFGASATPQSDTSPSSSSVPPPTNSQGWPRHKDANGNYAYKGPNGQWEEVR